MSPSGVSIDKTNRKAAVRFVRESQALIFFLFFSIFFFFSLLKSVAVFRPVQLSGQSRLWKDLCETAFPSQRG